MSMSQLDYPQVIKTVYDETYEALKVNVVAGGGGGGGGNDSVGPNGTTAPTSSTQIGAVDGSGDLQPLEVSATGALIVDGSTVTQPISGTVTAQITDSSGNSLTSTSSALDINVKSVTGSIPTRDIGFTSSQFIRNDYSGTPVTTGAYVQLIASTSALYQELEIFDSSGQTLQLALGAPASEVPFMLVTPGGNGRISFQIPASSRLSIQAVSANASVGEICVNLRG